MADHHFATHSCAKWLNAAASAARGLEREAAVDRTPKPCLHKRATHEHGTYACYVLDLCKCVPCATANSEYETDRRRRNAYGRSNFVDAEPVRQHVRDLQAAGFGQKRLVDLGVISAGTLTKLMYGFTRSDGTHRPPARRVHRETAEKILAVTTDQVADGARVPTTGPSRRLQALATLGWTVQALADHAGVDRQVLDGLLPGRRTHTTARTARTVRDLYDELWNTPRPTRSPHEEASAARARRRAQDQGWAPPMAWDDDTIDDPNAKPLHDVDIPAEARTPGRPPRTVDLDEFVHLITGGTHADEAARRAGSASLNALQSAALYHQHRPALLALANHYAEASSRDTGGRDRGQKYDNARARLLDAAQTAKAKEPAAS